MDKCALLCDCFMLAICIWNQFRYSMNMLFLIVPLTLIGIGLIIFGIVSEQYHFTETTLEITHRFRKKLVIPYASVFNYEALARDPFLFITQQNTVKVYYSVGNKKRMFMCRPKDAPTFVEVLRNNCVEFHADAQKKSKLDVFFEC